MFLRQRATQAEYFDLPDRPNAELVEAYASLARVNRLFVFEEPFQRLLPRVLAREECADLSLLDLGAGDGSLGKHLGAWAAKKHRWNWRFTNLDIFPRVLQLNAGGRNVAGSALALPFANGAFDIVIASQMTHHLNGDDEVIRHLAEAWRVARRAVFITDLHRGPILYAILWLLFRVHRYPEHFRNDGLLSVRRGFRIGELARLAQRAGLENVRARLYFGTRVILQARKSR